MLAAVALVGQRDQPVQDRGHLEHRVKLPGRVLADRLDPQDQVQALVVQVRERVRRVDRQRGQDRDRPGCRSSRRGRRSASGSSSSGSQTRMPCLASSGRSSLCQVSYCRRDEVVGPPRRSRRAGPAGPCRRAAGPAAPGCRRAGPGARRRGPRRTRRGSRPRWPGTGAAPAAGSTGRGPLPAPAR